jgi:hypothetical protein
MDMKSRSETLEDAIEEMIAAGKFDPGQHPGETELAASFGVSRTPVRETRIQLACATGSAIRMPSMTGWSRPSSAATASWPRA